MAYAQQTLMLVLETLDGRLVVAARTMPLRIGRFVDLLPFLLPQRALKAKLRAPRHFLSRAARWMSPGGARPKLGPLPSGAVEHPTLTYASLFAASKEGCVPFWRTKNGLT